MEYYILINNMKQGPFSLEDLRSKYITGNTMVWRNGLAQWVPASQLEELASIVNAVPPEPPIPMPKTWMVESILVTCFCCLPFGIVGIINASKVSSSYAQGFFQEAQRASAEAGKWTKIGFGIGLGVWILYILIYAFFFIWAVNDSRW